MPLAALETASQSPKTASAARTIQAMRAVRVPPDNVGGPYIRPAPKLSGGSVPLPAGEAAEGDQADQDDDDSQQEAPENRHQDPDDHEDASQRDPADAGSSVCPGDHLLLRSSVYRTTGLVRQVPGGARSHSGSGRSSPGQEPVNLAKEVRVPWSTRPLTRRKIAPSTISAATSFGQENSRCSGFGGSSSSIRPQTCSK